MRRYVCGTDRLSGGQALGPFQWQAPEVCKEIKAIATNQAATLATTPSDVYMLGAYW